MSLHYLGQHTQPEVAAFLEIPGTTDNRMHSARQHPRQSFWTWQNKEANWRRRVARPHSGTDRGDSEPAGLAVGGGNWSTPWAPTWRCAWSPTTTNWGLLAITPSAVEQWVQPSRNSIESAQSLPRPCSRLEPRQTTSQIRKSQRFFHAVARPPLHRRGRNLLVPVTRHQDKADALPALHYDLK